MTATLFPCGIAYNALPGDDIRDCLHAARRLAALSKLAVYLVFNDKTLKVDGDADIAALLRQYWGDSP